MVINDYRRSSIKFDVRGIRISADEIFFYTGLVLWLIQVYISRTVYINTFGNRLVTVIRYFCMLIFAVKIVLTEKTIQKRAAAVFLIAAALFVVVQRQIHTGMPLIQILLLVVGIHIKTEVIIGTADIEFMVIQFEGVIECRVSTGVGAYTFLITREIAHHVTERIGKEVSTMIRVRHAESFIPRTDHTES